MKPGEEIQSVSGWQTLSDRDIEQHWRQSEAASKSPQTHQLLNVTHNVGATILHHGNSGYTELDLNGLNTAGLVPPWFMHPELIAGPVNEIGSIPDKLQVPGNMGWQPENPRLEPTATFLNLPSQVQNLQSCHHLDESPAPRPPRPPPKESAARDQAVNRRLMELRKAGWGYNEIAKDLGERYNIWITPNALVKRAQKLQKTQENYQEPLTKVINNVIPDIMALIRNEAARIQLSAADQKLLDDLPGMIPSLVQSRILRKKAAMDPEEAT